MTDIDETSEPRNLRFLRRLVTVLTATMIGGVLTIIALLVIRLQAQDPTPDALSLPAEIRLPDGARPRAFTRGPDWFAVATDDSIFVFRPDGTLQQTVRIER